ncbi:MAG: OmpA family protein [Vicinamibacterales bacterium]|nr:OmpA family protein [Vicinamibacterales bacterium]
MMSFRHLAAGLALAACLASPTVTHAQNSDTRPAGATFLGDTGLWFVPTAEVLPAKKISVSAYRVNFDRTEAQSDISDFTGTIAVGLGDRAELFGSFNVVRRIAARQPMAIDGTPMDYPLINNRWAQAVGDMVVGAKVNLTSQGRNQPAAFALRGMVKVPTGDTDKGVATGKPDFMVDAIVSREMEPVELAGYVGMIVRGNPDDITLSNGLRWGAGISTPSRNAFRVFAEITGENYFDKEATSSRPVIAIFPPPPTSLPARWDIAAPIDAFLGAQYQTRGGVFFGAGISAGLNTEKDQLYPDFNFKEGDRFGFQFRIGYHPGVRVFVPPAPPPPPPPPPPANRPPTVTARCEPCTVEVGKASTVTADAQDPDGDTLAYKWSAPTGSFGNAGNRQTPWTAPMQEGAVPVTVTVDDGKGGTATDTVTIQVVRPARQEYNFEDVHFDFDRYSLRAEATRLLDDAVKAMTEDTALRLTLEGHTCSIGTAEYNLALGERRAVSVRDYLVSRGISADRLQTVSYGEERPKHDNAREETRRLNRRTALTIRMQ